MSSDKLPAPRQPTQSPAYIAEQNPVSKNPLESDGSQSISGSTGGMAITDRRIPQAQASENEAVPTPLAWGKSDASAAGEGRFATHDQLERHDEHDAEQMAAPKEGKIASVVADKSGGSGSQMDFAADLDRKKAEQATLREKMGEQRQTNVCVGGVLGQQSAPANPVGEKNYPNSSS